MTIYLQRRDRFHAGIDGVRSGCLRGGYTYGCSVTVSGQIDPLTGIVINIKEIDSVLKECVVRELEGTILDRDVLEFFDQRPTHENLTWFIWNRVCSQLPRGVRLEEVVLDPSPEISITLSRKLRSSEAPMLTVTKTYGFSASHRLNSSSLSIEENRELFGKCNGENGHGHNYELEVTLAGVPDPVSGELMAGETLDTLVEREVLKVYDHKNLNYDTEEFRTLNPTSENLTAAIWGKLLPLINALDPDRVRLYRIAVRETARNYFEYFGETPLEMR